MPTPMQHMLRAAAGGGSAGAGAGTLMLATDTAGIATLAGQAEGGMLAALLLVALMTLSLATAAAAAAAMGIGREG